MISTNPILVIAKFTLLEGVKNRLFTLIVIGVLCLSGLTLFIGELAVTETIEIQSALAGMILRLFAVFILCIFVISSTVREFSDKGLELILSLPVERYAYIAGKLLGFCLLSICISFIVSIPLIFLTNLWQLLLWSISLCCELWILTALSLLCVVTFKNITSAFSAVAAFYILSRIIDVIQLIGGSPILESANLSHRLINIVIDAIALVLPALEKFSKTEWLVYGGGNINDYFFVLVQTTIYVILIFSAACFDLHRKNF